MENNNENTSNITGKSITKTCNEKIDFQVDLVTRYERSDTNHERHITVVFI